MKVNGGRSRDEILAEVESVRSDLDSTLSAIERKLTPGQLVDQGIDYLRTSGANEYLHSLGNAVKQNPIPLALLGVCLGWMMMSGRSSGTSSGGTTQSSTSALRRTADDAWAGTREHARQARATLSDAAQAARERFDQTRQSVSSTAQSARDSLAGTAQSAREALSHGADVAQRQFERARGGYEWMVREQPLALGAIGIAIGALLATAAPRTEAEDEWMGEASDRLSERAKEAGREQMERAGDALRSAAVSPGADGEKPQGATDRPASGTSNPTPQGANSKPGWPSGSPPSE